MSFARRLIVLAVTTLIAAPAIAANPGAIHTPGVDGVKKPRLLKKTRVSPLYPAPAIKHGLDATVVVAVLVEADGSVSETLTVQNDQDGFGFEQAALDAVKEWRYRPARKQGRPVASFATVKFHFNPPAWVELRDAGLLIRDHQPQSTSAAYTSRYQGSMRSDGLSGGLPTVHGWGRLPASRQLRTTTRRIRFHSDLDSNRPSPTSDQQAFRNSSNGRRLDGGGRPVSAAAACPPVSASQSSRADR